MPNGWPGYKKGGGKGKGYGPRMPRRQVQQIVDSYLQPLLLQSIHNTLSERSIALMNGLSGSAEVPMRLFVSTSVNEANVIISSTAHSGEGKWIYTRPIVEVCKDPTHEPRVLGTLGVEADDERTSHVFTSNRFQQEVASISSAIEPYLSMLSGLNQRPHGPDSV
jgi:hypothetical protein